MAFYSSCSKHITSWWLLCCFPNNIYHVSSQSRPHQDHAQYRIQQPIFSSPQFSTRFCTSNIMRFATSWFSPRNQQFYRCHWHCPPIRHWEKHARVKGLSLGFTPPLSNRAVQFKKRRQTSAVKDSWPMLLLRLQFTISSSNLNVNFQWLSNDIPAPCFVGGYLLPNVPMTTKNPEQTSFRWG